MVGIQVLIFLLCVCTRNLGGGFVWLHFVFMYFWKCTIKCVFETYFGERNTVVFNIKYTFRLVYELGLNLSHYVYKQGMILSGTELMELCYNTEPGHKRSLMWRKNKTATAEAWWINRSFLCETYFCVLFFGLNCKLMCISVCGVLYWWQNLRKCTASQPLTVVIKRRHELANTKQFKKTE